MKLYGLFDVFYHFADRLERLLGLELEPELVFDGQ